MKLLHMSAPRIISSHKKNPFHGSGSLHTVGWHSYPEQVGVQCLARRQSGRTSGFGWNRRLLQPFAYSTVSLTTRWAQSLPPHSTPQTRNGLLQLLPAGLVARVARQRGRAGGGRGRARRHGSQGGGGSGVLRLLQLPGSVELLADAGL